MSGNNNTINNNNSNNNNNNINSNNNSNNNINTSVNTYNTPKTELETKKEILICKKDLYEHILSYKQHIFDVDVIRLADLDLNKNFLGKIEELKKNIGIEIDLLKEHYPELCELAKKAFNSISDYQLNAVSYGLLKQRVQIETQKKLNNAEYDEYEYDKLMALYDKRSSDIGQLKYKVEDSFPEYMNADRK
ncbi:hypothetical protein [Leuconostoc mesenteroides]|uniref:hypothetical protein n=1 Tax=Leuconostoc mesenteroides TaxID=1245 RepID=UPI0009FCCEE7|nr:hypothetical protein [Leuconostoc mesenteroides]ORI91752.1 hypothetical protein BMS99_09070 [Leuconostoc mesenteroides subsp. mesenteroides]